MKPSLPMVVRSTILLIGLSIPHTAAATTGLYVSSSGSAAIGTAAPQSMLQVYGGEVQVGSSGASCATANNGAIRFSGSTLYYCTGTTWTLVGAGGSGTVSSGTAGQVAYYQNSGTTVIGTSTINISGGNVAIGTTTPPIARLEIIGAGAAFPATSGTVQSSGLITRLHDTTNLVFDTGGYGSNGVWMQATDQNTLASQYPLLLNPNGGNVGIGSTSAAYTLQVNGSVAGTSAYVNTSDARYKKNVQPLDRGLDAVMLLKPVSFEWKDEVFYPRKPSSAEPRAAQTPLLPRPPDPAMRGEQIGFVAQDVEKVLPSVVVTEDNGEKTKGMKYSELIPILVKAIQEQQAQLAKDEETIAAMKAKLGMQ